MTQETKHTLSNLRLHFWTDDKGQDKVSIIGDDFIDINGNPKSIMIADMRKNNWKINAESILRACKNHYDLIEALEMCYDLKLNPFIKQRVKEVLKKAKGEA